MIKQENFTIFIFVTLIIGNNRLKKIELSEWKTKHVGLSLSRKVKCY